MIFKKWLRQCRFIVQFKFKKKTVSEAKSNDVKNYLLATSKFGEHVQEEVDMYITRDGLKKASFIVGLILLLKI